MVILIKKMVRLLLIIAILAVFVYLQNNWVVLTELEVVSERLPGNFDGFKIVQLSDLHSKSFGKGQQRLAGIVAGAKPDIIVITGDLVDGRHYDEYASLTLIREVSKIAPVYYITGNHEWWSGKFAGLEIKLKAAGAIVLRNDSRKITAGDQSIYITGLDDPESTGSIYSKEGYIGNKLRDTIRLQQIDHFSILLSHRPEAFNQYKSYGIDLIFSGHAHGGQFRLPFIGGLYAPDQGYIPKYTSGVYKDGNTSMVVSRGLGNSIMPLRLFNRPEITEVTLRIAGAKESAGFHAENAEDNQVNEEALSGVDQQATITVMKSYINEGGKTVKERIMVPEGFERIKVETGSFEDYLRTLPLKPDGAEVLYYNGDTKPADVYEAVLDIDVGERDLQQCADSVIRLRAEYLYGKGLFDKISFHFTNGFQADYSTWMKGNRIKVVGNKAYWVEQGSGTNEYSSFRKYLDMVFAYAGTLSLSKEMEKITLKDMQPGDVFLYGQTPGHCEIVLDMAENKTTGERIFILAQGYMPAQEMHILKNPANEEGNPWYEANFGERLNTPEWEFTKDQLMRFKE